MVKADLMFEIVFLIIKVGNQMRYPLLFGFLVKLFWDCKQAHILEGKLWRFLKSGPV